MQLQKKNDGINPEPDKGQLSANLLSFVALDNAIENCV